MKTNKKPQKENIRILIVDDLPQVRRGLATVLELAARKTGRGIEVVGAAQNGMEAIEKVRLLHPDVVLMDLEMPGMDGYEATRRIKLDSPMVWIIALTIHGDLASHRKAGHAGADAFIEKGIPIEELLLAIQRSRSSQRVCGSL